MSGDVQPRKRKEKRRKKAEEEYHIQRIRRASLDDDDAGTPPPMLVNPLEQSMENVTIHVHKEEGTGGHWCARIIFFALFTVLIGLIGVIIFEYRGTTDVDTPIASSRWATIFEGWVDEALPSHEGQSHDVNKHVEDDHDDEEEDEDEGVGSELEENEEAEEDENTSDEEVFNSPGESQEIDDAEEDDVDKSENDEGFEDDDEDEEEDIGVLDEVDDEESVENKNSNEVEEEDLSVPDLNVSIEGINPSSVEKEDDELDYEFVGIPGINEIDDDSAEPLEEIEDDEHEEVIDEIEIEVEPSVDETMEEESTSVDADLVAYTDEVRDLSRRNTIVPSANIKQLILTGDVKQKQQQAQNIQELNNKYKDLQRENNQMVKNKFVNPVGNQKVNKKEWDSSAANQLKKKDSQEVVTSESERFSGTENESDYDYDEDELDDEEVDEEEEDVEDEEEEDEEDDEEEELDDSELVAKLEAKYGKLATPSQRLNAPKNVHSSGTDKDSNKPKESTKIHQKPSSAPRGGQQAADVFHPEDHNELSFQEEIENWLAGDLDN
ncbi:hypothetical protein PV326_013706 [Microctonus aethiopoides]|nr:hypothetical protein PV326_013706 [Microctonus aethiopoides]